MGLSTGSLKVRVRKPTEFKPKVSMKYSVLRDNAKTCFLTFEGKLSIELFLFRQGRESPLRSDSRTTDSASESQLNFATIICSISGAGNDFVVH